jgi:hypothetical protein
MRRFPRLLTTELTCRAYSLDAQILIGTYPLAIRAYAGEIFISPFLEECPGTLAGELYIRSNSTANRQQDVQNGKPEIL